MNRSVFYQLLENGRLVWRLLQDNRVPTWLKVTIPLLVAVYLFSPFDAIPDFIPVLGELDDLGVILLGTTLLIRLAPQAVVDEHRRALGIDVAGGSGSAGQSGNAAPGGQARYQSGEPTRRMSENGASPIEGEYKVVRGEGEQS